MTRHPFRPAQGWAFVEYDHEVHSGGVILDVGLNIDRCLVGRDVIVRAEKPIALPLGDIAVRFSELVIVRIETGGYS